MVIDLYSRLVIGWAMNERMTADLACDALRMALWRRKQLPVMSSWLAKVLSFSLAKQRMNSHERSG